MSMPRWSNLQLPNLPPANKNVYDSPKTGHRKNYIAPPP